MLFKREVRETAMPEVAISVNFHKVGTLNHNKTVEQSVDWSKFRDDATALLERCGCKYYIKEDLRKAS